MGPNTSKAPLGERDALADFVVRGQAINDPENNPTIHRIQAEYVGRRFGLTAEHAQIVANLAFCREASR